MRKHESLIRGTRSFVRISEFPLRVNVSCGSNCTLFDNGYRWTSFLQGLLFSFETGCKHKFRTVLDSYRLSSFQPAVTPKRPHADQASSERDAEYNRKRKLRKVEKVRDSEELKIREQLLRQGEKGIKQEERATVPDDYIDQILKEEPNEVLQTFLQYGVIMKESNVL